MRGFIRRFLQPMFCEHDWEIIFDGEVKNCFGGFLREKTYRCKKCGQEKKYKSC